MRALLEKKAWVWGSFFIVLFCAFLLKRPCLIEPWGGTHQVEYREYCYNDIQALYGVRGLSEKKIPYLETSVFEYPPLIALQMYGTALFSQDHVRFFGNNVPINALCLALSFFWLSLLVVERTRLYFFSLSSCFFLYAFMNWDASSVLLLVGMVFFYAKEKKGLAGACAGLSLAGKLFPAVCFLPVLWSERKEKKSLQTLLIGFLMGAALFYLPLALLSLGKRGDFSLITSIFQFHAKRLPEFDTFWHWTAQLFGYSPFAEEYRIFVERVSATLLGLGTLFVLLRLNPSVWAKAGAILVLLLLVSKIYSPQYALWLLPFFVLLPTPKPLILVFYLTDFWGFFARFSWYPVMNTPDELFWKNQLMLAVLTRSLVFLLLFYYWSFNRKTVQVG